MTKIPTSGYLFGMNADRQHQRLSQVDALKSKGAVGENNRGLLEARGQGIDAGRDGPGLELPRPRRIFG